MQKFAIFTILLTMVVVVVVSEIVVNDYLPSLENEQAAEDDLTLTLPQTLDLSKSIATNSLNSGGGLTNYLGSDVEPGSTTLGAGDGVVENLNSAEDGTYSPVGTEKTIKLIDEDDDFGQSYEDLPESLPVDDDFETSQPIERVSSDSTTSGVTDFEDATGAAIKSEPSVYLREELLRSAGFAAAYLEDDVNDGMMYKTIQLDDLEEVTLNKTLIKTDNELLAKAYVISVGINANVNDIYEILKTRAASGLGIEVNETNQYGLASFFINDSNRPNTAFLTVRVGGLIYGFSYPKEYHPQIKNLVQLLMWELS